MHQLTLNVILIYTRIQLSLIQLLLHTPTIYIYIYTSMYLQHAILILKLNRTSFDHPWNHPLTIQRTSNDVCRCGFTRLQLKHPLKIHWTSNVNPLKIHRVTMQRRWRRRGGGGDDVWRWGRWLRHNNCRRTYQWQWWHCWWRRRWWVMSAVVMLSLSNHFTWFLHIYFSSKRRHNMAVSLKTSRTT